MTPLPQQLTACQLRSVARSYSREQHSSISKAMPTLEDKLNGPASRTYLSHLPPRKKDSPTHAWATSNTTAANCWQKTTIGYLHLACSKANHGVTRTGPRAACRKMHASQHSSLHKLLVQRHGKQTTPKSGALNPTTRLA